MVTPFPDKRHGGFAALVAAHSSTRDVSGVKSLNLKQAGQNQLLGSGGTSVRRFDYRPSADRLLFLIGHSIPADDNGEECHPNEEQHDRN